VLDITDYILIFLLGSFGGFLSGFLGVGGGIIYVPILDYFLSKMGLADDDLVKGILANSLFTIIFSGSVSSYKQYKLGNFYPKEIMYTAFPGVLTAIGMTLLIRAGSWYDKSVFNYVFATMLFVIAVKMFISRSSNKSAGADDKINVPGYAATGFFAGIITAMSGLGGGVVMTPVFTDLLKQNIKKASSISNGVIPFFAISVGILNLAGNPGARVHEWQAGYIIFPVVLPMIVASIIFAPIGVNTSQRSNQSVIRITFAFFISLVLLKTIYSIFLA
jgi:uncharacterized protein